MATKETAEKYPQMRPVIKQASKHIRNAKKRNPAVIIKQLGYLKLWATDFSLLCT